MEHVIDLLLNNVPEVPIVNDQLCLFFHLSWAGNVGLFKVTQEDWFKDDL